MFVRKVSFVIIKLQYRNPRLAVCPQPSAVFESLRDWGETLCAVSPNLTTIITGAASSVVCVWDVAAAKDKVTCVKLRQVCFFFSFLSLLVFLYKLPTHLDSP